ncbi:putative external mitochondrial NADH-ubiquinone oxidoreductase 1 precursor [Triangularia verruculosa]|uniref:External mitochondrial NADH-ubiquinone oxidoreductase 1 n=1 Tax=Triangularia verruculosa TaxID=2587418 RepID=A0AAN6XC23_9PEZI|nr:putative external mitochondrial NADH-ubiquinone oxidoreductase 1 precursor [Triangularia verruculosa]
MPSSLTRSLPRGLTGTSPRQLSLTTSPAPTSLIPSRHFSFKKGPIAKEKVVILGSGWAGYSLARTLSPQKYDRIIISPRPYFVFTPLLASTSVGTLEFRTILEPVRRLPGGNFHFYQGWADDIDFSRKTITVETNAAEEAASKTVVPPPGGQIPLRDKGEVIEVRYDKLIIAAGAYSQTFGIEGVREHAHFLRDIGDARRVRLRVLSLFEQCSYPSSPDGGGNGHLLTDDDKRALLHFAVVGGGPTGIEWAAELHDFIRDDLGKMYPELMPFVKITVYDVAPKVLPMFDKALADYAMGHFKRQGIEVKTEHHLERIRLADGKLGRRHGAVQIKIREVKENGGEVGAGMVVWSTGLMANPLIAKLAEKEVLVAKHKNPMTGEAIEKRRLVRDKRSGGLVVDGYMRALSVDADAKPEEGKELERKPLDDVYVIGDCNCIESEPLPKTAQVAAQEAQYLAKELNRGNTPGVEGKEFKYTNWGTMTYLGGWRAIHQSKADELKGWIAWVLWRGAYLTKSMSWRNKLLVPVYWVISWLFGRGISRF